MNCQKAGDLLSAYIEGEVTGRQCEALEGHLGGCADCREELDTLRSALALLAVPKTLVRPEGLLEEFKAKYLPEAEAAPAPRWGIKIPVLPKFEWPSLSQLMLPMGGMAAAGAAAALVVALHVHPAIPETAAKQVGPVGPRVAANVTPTSEDSTTPMDGATPSPVFEEQKLAGPGSVALKAKPASVEPRRRTALPRHAGVAEVSRSTTHRRSSHAVWGMTAEHRPSHRAHHRSQGLRLADKDIRLSPTVAVDDLARQAERNPEAVKSDELRWRDLDGQGGAIMHKAVAPVAEDGYAEVSCRNLSTGQVRSVAVSIPAETAPAGPAEDVTGANK
jgi:hypothetical protein